jgi:hypothetical protein
MFPTASAEVEVPDDYGATLADIKERVLTQRVRVVIAANAAPVAAQRRCRRSRR